MSGESKASPKRRVVGHIVVERRIGTGTCGGAGLHRKGGVFGRTLRTGRAVPTSVSAVMCENGSPSSVPGARCYCDPGWYGKDCDQHWGEYATEYEAFSWVQVAIHVPVMLWMMWRLAVTSRIKYQASKTCRSIVDLQFWSLFLLSFSGVFRTIYWVDCLGLFYAFYTTEVTALLTAGWLLCSVAAFSLGLNLYVSINARTQASRARFLPWIKGFLVAFCTGMVVLPFLALALTDGDFGITLLVSQIIVLLWLLAVVVFLQVFSVSTLKLLVHGPRQGTRSRPAVPPLRLHVSPSNVDSKGHPVGNGGGGGGPITFLSSPQGGAKQPSPAASSRPRHLRGYAYLEENNGLPNNNDPPGPSVLLRHETSVVADPVSGLMRPSRLSIDVAAAAAADGRGQPGQQFKSPAATPTVGGTAVGGGVAQTSKERMMRQQSSSRPRDVRQDAAKLIATIRVIQVTVAVQAVTLLISIAVGPPNMDPVRFFVIRGSDGLMDLIVGSLWLIGWGSRVMKVPTTSTGRPGVKTTNAWAA